MSKREHVLDSLFEDMREGIPKEDYNENWYEHKEQVRNLLKKGLYGFIGGTLIFGLMELLSSPASNNPGPMAFGEMWPILLISVIAGIACIGFPVGWELLNRLVGQWSIWGNLFIVVTLFVFKLAFALMIGLFAYPILLIYHIIKSQKSKRKVRRWTIIVISVVVLWYVFLGVCAIIVAYTDGSANRADSTEPPVVQTVDASTFDNQSELLDSLCQKALESTQETENECINSYGWTITSPTQVHGVFYLEAKDPEKPHYNDPKDLYVSNAIVVVTGYFLEDAGIPINQWEMNVWVYPNYSLNGDVLAYEADMEYHHSLRSDDMDDFMDWFSSEYSKMNITELTIPTN